MIKSLINKYNDTLIAVYIYRTAAYNHIPRNVLYRVPDFRTGASPLIAIYYKMYQGTTASILMVGHLFQNYDTIYVRYFATYTFLLCGVFNSKHMTIFLQTSIYMRTKKVHIYALQTNMCIWGPSRSSFKRHRIIPSAKNLLHVR